MQKIAWDITWDNLGAKDLFAGGSQAQSGHSLLRCILPLLRVNRTCLFALRMSAFRESGHAVLHCTCLLLTQSGHHSPRDLFRSSNCRTSGAQRRVDSRVRVTLRIRRQGKTKIGDARFWPYCLLCGLSMHKSYSDTQKVGLSPGTG